MGSTWNIATPYSGGPSLNGTLLTLSAGGVTTNISRQYNTVGEYRMLAKFTGASCSSCSSVNKAFITIGDANYP